MGCGSSSQPAVEAPSDKLAGPGSPDKSSPTVDTTMDKVETFKASTPSPSPVPANLQKDQPPSPESPVAPSYRSGGNNIDDNQSDISSFGSPAIVPSSYGSPGQGSSLDPFQPRPQLAPAYKLENEQKKIGGFDPEAFRKANQKGGFSDQGGHQNNQGGSDWASPNQNGGGGYGQGGYNNGGQQGYCNNMPMQQQQGYGGQQQGYGMNNNNGSPNSMAWGNPEPGPPQQQWKPPPQQQQDYIQSEDIFSTDSPQAYQNNQRMEYDDGDPFRQPGGLGHQGGGGNMGRQATGKITNNEDDALMDDILGELEDL